MPSKNGRHVFTLEDQEPTIGEIRKALNNPRFDDESQSVIGLTHVEGKGVKTFRLVGLDQWEEGVTLHMEEIKPGDKTSPGIAGRTRMEEVLEKLKAALQRRTDLHNKGPVKVSIIDGEMMCPESTTFYVSENRNKVCLAWGKYQGQETRIEFSYREALSLAEKLIMAATEITETRNLVEMKGKLKNALVERHDSKIFDDREDMAEDDVSSLEVQYKKPGRAKGSNATRKNP